MLPSESSSVDTYLQPTLPTFAFPAVLPPVVPVAETAVATVPVLHLINGEHYAGAERVQDLLALRLPEFGYSVGFACLKLDVFDEMRQSHDAPLFRVPMWSKFDLRAAAKVAALARQGDYRIIHSHTARTAMIGRLASAMTGIPLVYHAHSPTGHNSTRRVSDWISAKVERWSLGRVSQVIAVSEAMADYMAGQGVDRHRIAVVRNGVPGPSELPWRARPNGTWTLGTVALFRPRKGVEVLLEALAILRQQGLPVRLRAVGTFESTAYEREIADRVRRLGLSDCISWTGFTRDVAAQLAQMDLLVLPSLFGEGLPMVVLEAMAAGVPVVATSVPGVPEAVRDGREGVLAAPGDAADLAQAIAKPVAEYYDWGKLREAAFRRHAELFSDRAMAAGVAEVYREVLRGG